jgi:hypothetical protein
MRTDDADSFPHWFVRGMLWNCLFPVQFPECWDVDRHAGMDVVLEEVIGRYTRRKDRNHCRVAGYSACLFPI